jgi:hypothetical protein
MLLHLFCGAALISVTVILHAVLLEKLLYFLEWLAPILSRRLASLWKISLIVITVYGVMAAIILEIWIWAGFFYLTGEAALHNWEAALYFSTTTFTTLGFGDITLSHHWRLLASVEAANGLLLFGWSTAFLFEVLSNLSRYDRVRG